MQVDPEQIVDDVTNEVEVTTGEMESDDTQTVEIVGTVHQEAYICTDNRGMFNGNYVIDGEAILDIIEVQSTPEVKVAFSEQSTKNQHHGLSHMQTEIQPADSEGVVHVRKYEKEEVTFHIYNSSDNNTSTTEEPLKVEAEKSQGKGKFTCSECFHTFKRESTLKLHKKIHYNPYKCKTCGKCFSLASQLRKHAVIHSGTRPFKCHICSKAFHYSCSLMTHLRTHSLEKPFKCPHCDKSFVQSGNLTTHLMKHINKGEDDKLFKCEKCDKKFVSQEEWRAHFDSHSEDEPETKGFMCDLCGKYFKNRQYEAAHMLSHQKTFLKCPQCGKSLKNEKTLAVHMASVHCNEAKFMCEECGKLYTTKQSLRQHMKVHAVTLEYSMAKAKWREILESKKQQQQEDKKAKPAEPKKLHTCEECSKTFTEKRHLKDHMLIHAGRKDHVCTECGHSFRQKSTLTRHMKVSIVFLQCFGGDGGGIGNIRCFTLLRVLYAGNIFIKYVPGAGSTYNVIDILPSCIHIQFMAMRLCRNYIENALFNRNV